jgi:glycosyltransferase involved in cell wall biosynthesis
MRRILFNTPWMHPADGWSIASRVYARAMQLGGLDVLLRDWQRPAATGLDEEVFNELLPTFTGEHPLSMLTTEQQLNGVDLHVFSCALLSADKLGVLDAMLDNREPQAFYCVFERRYIEPELVEKMNRLAGVWVQCRMNEHVLREAGVQNVTLIPYPFFGDDPHVALDKPRREPKRFYNIGRFEPRKAPDNIIRAFLRAFAPGESKLTLKTSPIPHVSEYASAWTTIDHELIEDAVIGNGWNAENVWDDVRIIEGRISRDEMLGLHADGDVYVSASRGEGLELGAWAAKLAGRRIIATASGGPEDFLDPEVDICIPATGFVPADPSYPWGEGATYIDYSIDDLVEAMQTARGQHACGTRTWPGWERHRAPKVGEALKEWVESLTRGTPEPAAARLDPGAHSRSETSSLR